MIVDSTNTNADAVTDAGEFAPEYQQEIQKPVPEICMYIARKWYVMKPRYLPKPDASSSSTSTFITPSNSSASLASSGLSSVALSKALETIEESVENRKAKVKKEAISTEENDQSSMDDRNPLAFIPAQVLTELLLKNILGTAILKIRFARKRVDTP